MTNIDPKELVIQKQQLTEEFNRFNEHPPISVITNLQYNIFSTFYGNRYVISCKITLQNRNVVVIYIALERYPFYEPKIYINDRLALIIDNISFYLYLNKQFGLELPYNIDIKKYENGQYKPGSNLWLLWNRQIHIYEILCTIEYLLNYNQDFATVPMNNRFIFKIFLIPQQIIDNDNAVNDNAVDDDDDKYKCGICLQPLLEHNTENHNNNEGGYIYHLHYDINPSSPHLFHVTCLNQWTLHDTRCPTCKNQNDFYLNILTLNSKQIIQEINGNDFFNTPQNKNEHEISSKAGVRKKKSRKYNNTKTRNVKSIIIKNQKSRK